ncbi:MAG: YitT family protein [Pseudomonadota bacterium]
MPSPYPIQTRVEVRHTPIEDAQGLSIGVILCTAGVVMLTHLGLITGQTAGLAVLISYVTGWSFGTVFIVINIPFYVFALKIMGLEFVVKSMMCVIGLSLGTELLPLGFRIEHLDPALGSILFGVLAGIGLLSIFRHRGSLVGFGVLALWIQDTYGIRAGHVQLAFDAVLFLVAAFLFDLPTILFSLLGALALNALIAFNHRRDWYVVK